MALVTITQAAKLTSRSKQTLYRHIGVGKLSRRSDSLIDTAELIRIYGELKPLDAATHAKKERPVLRTDTGESDALRAHIETLQHDVAELKLGMEQQRADGVERERRLMALLEHRLEATPEATTTGSGLFKKLFG